MRTERSGRASAAEGFRDGRQPTRSARLLFYLLDERLLLQEERHLRQRHAVQAPNRTDTYWSARMSQRRTNPTARARLSPSEGETRSAQLQGRMHNSVVRGSCHICSGTGLARAISAPGLGVLQRLVRARACADSAAPRCCAAGNGSTCATRGTERAVESPPAQHSVAHAA